MKYIKFVATQKVTTLSHFSFGFKVQMGRIQPVVMAPKNPFFHPSLSSYLPPIGGLAGIRTHNEQLFNQSHLPHGHNACPKKYDNVAPKQVYAYQIGQSGVVPRNLTCVTACDFCWVIPPLV